MATIVYWDISDPITDVILTISGALLIIAAVITSLCPIFLHNTKYKEHNYEKIIKERLDSLISKENEINILEGNKHILWSVQNNYLWLELHIDRVALSAQENIPISKEKEKVITE